MQKELHNYLYITFAVLILLLSIFNLLNIGPKKNMEVLGATDDRLFWKELATKHPTYKDAWIELGRIDKVRQIDPNFTK